MNDRLPGTRAEAGPRKRRPSIADPGQPDPIAHRFRPAPGRRPAAAWYRSGRGRPGRSVAAAGPPTERPAAELIRLQSPAVRPVPIAHPAGPRSRPATDRRPAHHDGVKRPPFARPAHWAKGRSRSQAPPDRRSEFVRSDSSSFVIAGCAMVLGEILRAKSFMRSFFSLPPKRLRRGAPTKSAHRV
jgi:hypothetical protein